MMSRSHRKPYFREENKKPQARLSAPFQEMLQMEHTIVSYIIAIRLMISAG